MNKADRVVKTIGNVITYVLVVLLVLGIAGVIVYFVATNEGISFYIDCNGERYYSSVDSPNLALTSGETYVFDIRSLTGENVEYSVAVQSSSEYNFTFVSDGETYDFYVADDTEYNDYSSVFDLKKSADSFSITIPKDITVEEVVETKDGKDIQVQGDLQEGVPYFVITVNSDDNSLNLAFRFDLIITIDPPSIVF